MKSIHSFGTLLVLAVLMGTSRCMSGDLSTQTQEHLSAPPIGDDKKVATVAGGCFWCVEADFEKVPGVTAVISGYTGGKKVDPSYEDVWSGRSGGHLEAVQIHYDPSVVSFDELLDVFWRNVDPTDAGGQFVDRGSHYRTAIFYHDSTQLAIATKSRDQLATSGAFDRPIVTELVPFERFYPAEDYHQDYYKTHPRQYNQYRRGSGRDQFLEKTWENAKSQKEMEDSETSYARPSDDVLRQTLTPLQYRVTQEEGTERAFDNAYWDNKEDGIYVDVVSGEPLFSSRAKFKSGSGWPSFTEPLVPENVIEREDRSLLMTRTEVRSRNADSHLGHLFNDGPKPTGLRYCVNSAALRFVALEDLETEGYSAYANLFATE